MSSLSTSNSTGMPIAPIAAYAQATRQYACTMAAGLLIGHQSHAYLRRSRVCDNISQLAEGCHTILYEEPGVDSLQQALHSCLVLAGTQLWRRRYLHHLLGDLRHGVHYASQHR
eukprot:scaffold624_cov402-Prasinococcus_capsulatus_cf.AAC.25